MNPASPGYKGAEWAKKHWAKKGKKPPTSPGPSTGNLLALPAPANAPAPTPPTPTGGVNAVIAVAALQNGALVQSLPTPRIKAVRSGSGGVINLLPDSGATMNIACKASAEAWGLEVAPLDPGEVSLTDVQGGSIPLLGKAQLTLKLPSRNIEATVQLVVADTLGLPELIIGWVDLHRWGILRLEEGEVPASSRQHGVFMVSSAAQDFLNKQTVFPPRRSFKEIDPCDPQYVQKMEVQCSLLRQQLLDDVPLAFSDQLSSDNVANFPPLRVKVREGMEPVKVFTARPFPLGREARCREVINDLLSAGTIMKYEGHSDWVSPAFFVRKGSMMSEGFVTYAS